MCWSDPDGGLYLLGSGGRKTRFQSMMSKSAGTKEAAADSVEAGLLRPWNVGELPPPPRGLRSWLGLMGPGVLLAGASVGSGEWLFGPAVSAQYGGTLLWLATVSILCQVFCNLEMMRYTLYCGEPVLVGIFRTWPGPMALTIVYGLLDTAVIWPYNAQNAAVPLTAAILGHLPGDGLTNLLGLTLTEGQLVKMLGYVTFVAALSPLFFGGAIYRTLLRIMATKLVLVLGYLTLICLLMVSARNVREVVSGFLRVGSVPLRADTVIAGRHFSISERVGAAVYTVKGTIENGQQVVTAFLASRGGQEITYGMGEGVPADLQRVRRRLLDRAERIVRSDRFFVEDAREGVKLTVEGVVAADQSWQPQRFTVTASGFSGNYNRLEHVPEPHATRFRELIANQGVERVGLLDYASEHGRLPNLDWALLAAFAAIAGGGGIGNTLFSNFTRDKGWGMGAQVGAIPSLVGGRLITLSHVGKVFRPSTASLSRWRGWIRHIVKDQVAVWMFCSILGMALPCMLSLEFIRNAPVSGNRVAAMTAEGMAARYPDSGQVLWSLTLLCGFVVLAPGQILAADQVARRWTDIIWTAHPRAQRMHGNQVKYVYYSILVGYGAIGLVLMAFFDPLVTAKIGAGLMNVGLGAVSLHTLYVNRTLLPPALRPNWLMQLGVLSCGVFFLGISAIVVMNL